MGTRKYEDWKRHCCGEFVAEQLEPTRTDYIGIALPVIFLTVGSALLSIIF